MASAMLCEIVLAPKIKTLSKPSMVMNVYDEYKFLDKLLLSKNVDRALTLNFIHVLPKRHIDGPQSGRRSVKVHFISNVSIFILNGALWRHAIGIKLSVKFERS